MFTFEITPSHTGLYTDSGSRFLQSPFWASFKAAHGWKPLCFEITVKNKDIFFSFSCSVLIRIFGKRQVSFSIAYIPMMIELPLKYSDTVGQAGVYTQLLIDFVAALKPYLPGNTVCVRFDPPFDFYTCETRDLFVNSLKIISLTNHLKIVKTKVDIQPPDTVLLDITQSPDVMLSAMRSKWRYNIHLAEKKGVIVHTYKAGDQGIENALNVFYDLYRTTATRDGIALHSKQYYSDLISLSASGRLSGGPLISLYVASHENDYLAAIITLFSKREAVYLYGASSNVKRNLMPAYLLQWTAINDAKKYGSPVYDFYGMPPSDDKNHPMYGLYLFKTGFGGKIVHRPGSIDVPVSRMYKFYIVAEDIRAFYHKKIKKLFTHSSASSHAGREK
ncbi:MAG: peptidoglycan bridge formation glycyltransferase FemA/FemB family protein [Treponema sp.]|nr:peptidoglycan bridge formation glycyltransferase FemA/FemB family protein [Treponema sp.]